jgi:hypothetical protein
MLGHAQLRIRQRAWIEDSVTASCAVVEGSRGAWRCTVGFALAGAVHSANDRVGLTVCEAAGAGCVSSTPAAVHPAAGAGGRMALSLVIPAAKLWTPGTRQARADLYVANVTLVGGGGRSIATTMTRFGIRSIK